MILTTARIVCLNNKNSAFKAFDLPLALTFNEGFEQPIFGANYIKGTCKPLINLPGNVNFKIWFMSGGCGTFAPAYLKMVYSMRMNRNRGIDQQMQRNIESGNFGKTAYIDPDDPSVIYLQQPQVVQGINYNPFGYQPIPQQPIQQQPMYQQPIQQQPINQQPMYHQPINQQPMYQQPIQQQPMYQQPMYQQPIQQQPIQQHPMYQKPIQQQPMYQQPIQQQTLNQQPINQQPMYQQPNQQHPMYQQPQTMNQSQPLSNQQIMEQRQAYYNNQMGKNESQTQQNLNNQQNNPYPIFDPNNNLNAPPPNQDLPSMEQVINQYPEAHNVQVLNNVDIQSQNQDNQQQKYFGFFGPNLVKNNNNNQ